MEEKTKNGEHDEAGGRENDREAQTAARGKGERAKITTKDEAKERKREREREKEKKTRGKTKTRAERKEGARARGTHGDVKRNDAEGRGDAARGVAARVEGAST